jgi:hypothetical protein
MVGRLTRVLGALGTTLVALVLAHSVVFLLRYGSVYGEALAHNGHDLAWTLAVAATVALATGLGLAAIVQLARLHRAARDVREGGLAAAPGTSTWRAWLGLGCRLALVTALLLTVQENVERLAGGLASRPDPFLLVSAAYPWAPAVVAGVALAIAAVIVLFRQRRDALLARIRGCRRHARAASDRRPIEIDLRPIASLIGAARAVRAPPAAIPS